VEHQNKLKKHVLSGKMINKQLLINLINNLARTQTGRRNEWKILYKKVKQISQRKKSKVKRGRITFSRGFSHFVVFPWVL